MLIQRIAFEIFPKVGDHRRRVAAVGERAGDMVARAIVLAEFDAAVGETGISQVITLCDVGDRLVVRPWDRYAVKIEMRVHRFVDDERVKIAGPARIVPEVKSVRCVVTVRPGAVRDLVFGVAARYNMQVPARQRGSDTAKGPAVDRQYGRPVVVPERDPRRLAAAQDLDHLLFHAHNKHISFLWMWLLTRPQCRFCRFVSLCNRSGP